MKYDIYIRNKNDLSLKRVSSLWLWIPFLIYSTLGVTLGVGLYHQDIIINHEGTYAIENKDEFSEEKLKLYINELNIPFGDIVFAQSKLESGNFKSNIFLENHNLFGLKEAKIRSTTALGEQNNHAYYTSWRESVLDYALYSCKYLSGLKTRDDYLNYLSMNYAEDTNYIIKLKKILK